MIIANPFESVFGICHILPGGSENLNKNPRENIIQNRISKRKNFH